MSKATDAAVEIPQAGKKEGGAAEAESVYSVDELTPDIVKTALRMEGVTETTVSEAKRIVAKFKKREVR